MAERQIHRESSTEVQTETACEETLIGEMRKVQFPMVPVQPESSSQDPFPPVAGMFLRQFLVRDVVVCVANARTAMKMKSLRALQHQMIRMLTRNHLDGEQAL